MQAPTIPPYRSETRAGDAAAAPAGQVPAPTTTDPGLHAWPDEAAPPPRRPSPWRWLYLPASFAIGLVVADPDAPVGTRIGYAAAVLAAAALTAALFYIWRTSTRPAIPVTTFILAFLITGVALDGKEDNAGTETEALRWSADQFALGDGFATMDEDPPDGVDARWIWASRKALEDVAAHYRQRANARSLVPGRTPDDWPTAVYIAAAGEYPQVQRYFAAYRAYLAEADSSTLPVYFERLHDRLRQAGFSEARARSMMTTAQVGASAALQAKQEEFRLAAQLADSALALHALLVRADPRVHYDADADRAGFERETERKRATALVEEISTLNGRLEDLRQPARSRLKARRHNPD